MAYRFLPALSTSGTREINNRPSSSVTVWGRKDSVVQCVSLHIVPSSKFIVRAEVRWRCHKGVLSLQEEVMPGERKWWLFWNTGGPENPTSTITDSERFLVSSFVKWKSWVHSVGLNFFGAMISLGTSGSPLRYIYSQVHKQALG